MLEHSSLDWIEIRALKIAYNRPMQNTSLFSYEGRLGRLNYLILSILAGCLFGLFSIFIIPFISAAIPENLVKEIVKLLRTDIVGTLLVSVPTIIFTSSYTVRRWRDILPQQWAHKKVFAVILILEFVPYLAFVIFMMGILIPGGTSYKERKGNRWLESFANKKQKDSKRASLSEIELKADSIIKQALHDHYDDVNAVQHAMAKYEAQLKYYFPGEQDETYQNALKASLLRRTARGSNTPINVLEH